MDSSNFEELGQNLLESFQKKNQSTPSSYSTSSDSSLYQHMVELSNFIKSKKIFFNSNAVLSSNNFEVMRKMIFKIFDDLSQFGHFPSSEIGLRSSENEAYELLAFSLYVLQNNSNSDIDTSVQIQKLKNDLQDLQNHYDYLLQNSSDLQSISQLYETTNSTKKDLQTEIEKLNYQLELYEGRDKETQALVMYLKHHFNLAESTNIHNIIDAITIQNTCKISEEDRIEHLKLQNQDLENQLMGLSREKNELEKRILNLQNNSKIEKSTAKENETPFINTSIFVLENDISALQIQLKDMENKYEAKKDKVNLLNSKISEKEDRNKYLERQLEALQIKYDKLLIENEDNNQVKPVFSQIPNEAQLRVIEEENENLKIALNDLSEQLEKMNQDMFKEIKIKNDLFNILQKQNEGISFAESKIKELQSEQNLKELVFQQNSIQQNKEKTYSNVIINELKQFLISYPIQDDDKLYGIINCKELDSSSKIIRIAKSLLDDNTALYKELTISGDSRSSENIINNIKNENKRLYGYTLKMLQFIEQIADSGEVQKLIMEKQPEEGFREKLLAQCSRVESFLKENRLDDDELTFNENFLDISNFAANVAEQIDNPNPNELVLLLRQSAFINDTLKRFAEEMKQQSEHFCLEMKKLRYELKETQDSIDEKVKDQTIILEEELMKEREKNGTILKLQKILRQAAVSECDENFVTKCLRTIQIDQDYRGGEPINEPEIDDKFDHDKYILKIEGKLNEEMESREATVEQANEIISKLKTKIKAMKKRYDAEKQQFLKEIENTKSQFDEISDSINKNVESSESLKKQLDEKNQLVDQLCTKIKNLDHEIEEFKELREQEKNQFLSEIKNENEKILKEKEEKINTLSLSLQNSQAASEEQIKFQKQEMKTIVKKLQSDVELENQRANDLRMHFESLLSDMKKKLHQSRESENNAVSKLAKVESELKDAKSTLSKIRIDMKMLNLKVTTSEDKLNRERSLFETQLKMRVLGLQTDHQTQMGELRDQYDNNIHQLLVSICEIFKDYVDLEVSISEESVLSILHNVSNILEQAKQQLLQKQIFSSTLCDIKSIISVQNDNEIVQNIIDLMKDAKEFREKKIKIQNDYKNAEILVKKATVMNNNDKISREWESWARRLHSLVTDSFSTAKTTKQLRFAIEEALMNAIGQRQSWRKLEILRMEKSILISGLLHKKKKKINMISMFSIVVLFVGVYRIQKLSGHLKCNISLSSKHSKPNEYIEPPADGSNSFQNIFSAKKHYPILNLAES